VTLPIVLLPVGVDDAAPDVACACFHPLARG
jgi:hypothetical protein